MLDTGATDVAVPAELAELPGAQARFAVTLSTANGRSQGYRTHLDRLQLGDIVLQRRARPSGARGWKASKCCWA
jgi:aspartyl protease family protein